MRIIVRHILILLSVCFLFVSCEREIDFSYRGVTPKPVIVAVLTQDSISIHIDYTRDMEQPYSPVEANAIVVVSDPSAGFTDTLAYKEEGNYSSLAKGVPGHTYLLDVQIAGVHYTSISVMPQPVQISKVYYEWRPILTEEVLLYHYQFQDEAEVENYYQLFFYRNDSLYQRSLYKDKGNVGEIIEKDLFCMTKRMREEPTDDTKDRIIYDGDRLRIQLRSHSRRTFDYLYSLNLSSSGGYNPTPNFSNEALGYFAATYVSDTTFFHKE